LPVCSALDGLSTTEREKIGEKSAVTKLAFVAAFVVEEGVSLDRIVGRRPDTWIITPVSRYSILLIFRSDLTTSRKETV
jgi:hypothetical protein